MKPGARLFRSLLWVFACHMGMAGAQEATPMAGTYIRKGGGGDLVVQANGQFRIKTLGSNRHTCGLAGTIVGGYAKLAGTACVVSFTPIGHRVEVVASDGDACKGFCGAMAWFGGDYLRPTPACTDKAIAASRQKFKRAYDAKDYALAQATLAPVLAQCDATLTGVHMGWIRNDLALAQLRAGDAAACRQTLAPLAAEADKSDQELSETYARADAEVVMPMLHAARTNLRLCRGG